MIKIREVILWQPPTFASFLKSRKLLSFFKGFCVCFGEKVLSIELKSILCCIKRQKQRYFHSLTKRWPWLINLQPFERGRIFRIKQKWSTIFFAKKWSTKPSGFTSCGDSRSSLKKRSFFFTSSPAWILPWSGPQTGPHPKENVFHGSRNPESRQA